MTATRLLAPGTALLVVWLALARSLTPGQVVAGVAVSAATLVLVPVGGDTRLRWGALPRLLRDELAAVARSTAAVLRETVTPGSPNPGVVDLHLPGAGARELAWLAALLTLTPGAYVVDLDADRQLLRVHLLDATDLDVVAEDVRRLDRDVRAVFGGPPPAPATVTLVEGPA